MKLINTGLGEYGLKLKGFVVSSLIKEGQRMDDNTRYAVRETMISTGKQAYKHSQNLDVNLTHDQDVELLTQVEVEVESAMTSKGMTTVRGEMKVLDRGLIDHRDQMDLPLDKVQPAKVSGKTGN